MLLALHLHRRHKVSEVNPIGAAIHLRDLKRNPGALIGLISIMKQNTSGKFGPVELRINAREVPRWVPMWDVPYAEK